MKGIWKIQTTRRWASLLTCVAVATQAQTATPEAAQLADQRARAAALEKRLPVPKVEAKASFDLSPARQERFQKYLPKAWNKLSQREPLHILTLGDAETLQVHEGGLLESFPALFAQELATQFFYTGGVVKTGESSGEKGPAISLRTLSRSEGSALDAAAILSSTARQAPVDVLLLCYGQDWEGLTPVTYARAINSALAVAREIGAEVILCSPWLPMSESSEKVLGLGRPLADVLSEIATDESLLHVDLGDLARLFQVPTAEKQDEGQVFERIERTYRAFFYQQPEWGVTARATLHRQLGSMIFKDLLDPAPTPSWQIESAIATQTEPGKLRVRCSLQNKGKSRLDLITLPLLANGLKPVEAQSKLSLEAGATQTIEMSYQGRELSLLEPLLRLPLLVSAGTQARVETLRARVEPVALVWGAQTLFNQEAEFLASAQIVNTGKNPAKGTWKAEFGSQKQEGSYDLASGATSPLDLRFKLPAEIQSSAKLALKLTVKQDGQEIRSSKSVWVTRNLGLGQTVPLVAWKEGAQVAPTLTTQANASSLTFTCNIPSADLLQDAPSANSPAWQLDLHLDARSYGKRLEQGSTAGLRITGTAAPGAGQVHAIPAWAFGTGYAASFDPKEFKTAMTSGENSRQITFTLPRTYLYLHEWALDNGNSQFGLNVRLTLMTADGFATYSLVPTTKPADDIEALAVLELTEKPTQRSTISVE